MIRSLVWLAVSVVLLWLCFWFSSWRLMWQLFLLSATLAWVLAGAIGMGKAWRAAGRSRRSARLSQLETAAYAERQKYAQQFGDDAMRKMDAEDPGFWARQAYHTMGKK